ncbi:phytanoyl-CoA dioxygenase family protein [Planctomicrobium sp. SH661]|uniref:phytanoyl-CoA dioxygenase family protein n=1 Tax=Planctomicrobium sp. SH661 TaxID=3448124 RepID=UPI003F5BA4C2
MLTESRGQSPVSELTDFYRANGYFIRERVFTPDEVHQLCLAMESLPEGEEVRRKRNVYGVRNLLEICPQVRAIASEDRLLSLATSVLGAQAFAVRAIFFDKVPGANWSLFWHQDSVISVKERVEVPGFSSWSQKVGVWQVQPPSEVLAQMVALRVHLDDCGADNGPLRVLPGSHLYGWLDEKLDEWKARVPEVTCTVGSGGIVGMCPMTLHASAASQKVGNRRVIHIEYAAADLPGGLQWNNSVGRHSSTTAESRT